MAKKHACKSCGFVSVEEICPACGSTTFATTILGRMIIFDPAKSKVAGLAHCEKAGEYAIKMR